MKKAIVLILFIALGLSVITCKNEANDKPDKMDWWRDARFGLFIHWGLYSIPAGEWNEKTNYAEWIRDQAQIPLGTYNEFINQFNPVKFNAAEWVSLAKNAGMKYIVITSKHHDGFCLFDSQETDYDIMSTPFKRDILKELADACAEQGIKLCFYHSIMDWHHPDYLPRRNWEKDRPADSADMKRYISYMKNQLSELLANYGDIGVLWFDGEWENTWNHEQGKDLYNYLIGLKPNLIVNNRVDKGRQGMAGMTADSTFYGDFGTPEQEIPATGLPDVDWESCITMNDHWGYNKNDHNWKSSEDLVRKLIDIASKGGNFLLNVGPTAEGLFPDSSIVRLEAMGTWMKQNGEAIYGTKASPFSDLQWGKCTYKPQQKNSILYLHVFDWPADGKISIPGINNKVLQAYALNDADKKNLPTEQSDGKIFVNLNGVEPSPYATVIALKIKGNSLIK